MIARVLLADDHPVFRAGLRALIAAEPTLDLVGEAADGDEVVQLAEQLGPDIVLLDISMPGLDGIQATRRILDARPDTRVLVLTAAEEISLLRASVRAGAVGYVIKRVAESELMNAIHAVTQGDLYIHSSMTPHLLSRTSDPAPVGNTPIEELTPRETEVLDLISRGFTNPEIACELQIGVRTVESHRANLMGKLDVRSRVDLVRYAHEHHLIHWEEA